MADFSRGRLEDRAKARLLALPGTWLEQLLALVPVDRLRELGESLARAVEPTMTEALDGEGNPSPADVAYALSAALSAHGLGHVVFEQWGDALVVCWEQPPARGEAWNVVAAAAVAAALSKAAHVDLDATMLESAQTDGGTTRVLVASKAVCEHARSRTRAGERFGEVLAQLESGVA